MEDDLPYQMMYSSSEFKTSLKTYLYTTPASKKTLDVFNYDACYSKDLLLPEKDRSVEYIDGEKV